MPRTIEHAPILTSRNTRAIASVLADPPRAWRGEPAKRKRAFAGLRGKPVSEQVRGKALDHALEQLIDGDDMVPGIWVSRAQAATKAVAFIDSADGPATGFLVSDDLLLTNWHVLPGIEQARDPRTRVVFGWEEDDNGNVRRAVRLPLDPDRFFVNGDSTLDFALVAVGALPDGRAPGRKFGHIPLVATPGKALLGTPVNIVQHPGGRPRRLAFRNNLLVSVDDPLRLVYSTDTMPGSSGSPVFSDDWRLIALHHAAEDARNADGVAIDLRGDPVTDATPEHLRHWVANAGIRVSGLVAHLAGLTLAGDAATLLAAAINPEEGS